MKKEVKAAFVVVTYAYERPSSLSSRVRIISWNRDNRMRVSEKSATGSSTKSARRRCSGAKVLRNVVEIVNYVIEVVEVLEVVG